MQLKWIGPADRSRYLEGFPCRDMEEPDEDRAETALESGLFVAADQSPQPATPSTPPLPEPDKPGDQSPRPDKPARKDS